MTDRNELNSSDKDGSEAGTQASVEQRRRLLKLGITAAPLVLTLHSRSALACHCKSPSAGGSVTHASAKPNDPVDGFDINGSVFSYDVWMTHSSLPGGVTKTTQLKDIPLFAVPFAGDTTKIKNLQPGFRRDIVTAYLNISNSGVARGNCLSLAQLQVMASGSYTDSTSGISFNSQQIRDYLGANFLLG